MRATRAPLAEMVDTGRARRARGGPDPDEIRAFRAQRRRLLRGGIIGGLGAAGLGSALLTLMESPAFAGEDADVEILQTAASIENLAVAAYDTALTLDFIGGASAIPVVTAFATTTRDQHAEHAAAFNAAVTKLGGREQDQPDPVLNEMVEQAVPGLTGPGPVVDLALELENTAAQTYVANVGALGDLNARKVTASIMGVEAQHVSVLLAVKALLEAGAPQLIALPTQLDALPGAAGDVGFPNAFSKTADARPADEGAVK